MAINKKRREHLAIKGRSAYQMARFRLDSKEHRNPQKALEWAQEATARADEFQSAVEEETGLNGR